MTIYVLQDGTVLHKRAVLSKGAVLAEGTVIQEAIVIEECESVGRLIEEHGLEQVREIIIKDGNEFDDHHEPVEDDDVSREEIIDQHNLICSICTAEFLHEEDLERHRETCSKMFYFCNLCEDQFETEDSLSSHYRSHSDDIISCVKRQKNIQFPENIGSHEEECWTINCVLCDKSFQSKAQLNSHLLENHSEAKVLATGEPSRSSSLEERLKCKLCPRSFTRVGSLNYHVSRKHAGTTKERNPSEFPHLCQECGNRYKSGTQLCRHQRWECGKEPMFKCQMCIKKFHHRHGLKQHIRLHLAKRGAVGKTLQFYCEKCGRGYKLKSSLNNHMKWECGKEPIFSCTLCNVKFSYKGNLKKHILKKHVA